MLRSLDWMLYANPLRTWLLASLVAVLAFAVLKLVIAVALRSLARLSSHTRTSMDDVLVETVRCTRGWFIGVVSLFAGSQVLVLPTRMHAWAEQLTVLAFLVQFGVWGRAAIRSYVDRYTERTVVADAARVTTVRALGFLATLALGSVLVLMALANVGIDITALVAGLGIGGVAIALAVQNILGDLFASLSIVLDKPFVYGDFIVVDDMMGTVENVGLKTTRVRSLSGEQLVFSNSDLLKSRIRNFKRMQERRVVFTLGVLYSTPPSQLEDVPGMVREIVEEESEVRFDRAHLKTLGDSAVVFEIVYYVLTPDHVAYMDRHQAICLKIMRRFEAEGIGFAFPTQTIYLERGSGDGGGERGARAEVRRERSLAGARGDGR